MRSASIFLLVYLVWLAMPPMGQAGCLLLGLYFGWRIWALIRLADSDLQVELSEDLALVEYVVGKVEFEVDQAR